MHERTVDGWWEMARAKALTTRRIDLSGDRPRPNRSLVCLLEVYIDIEVYLDIIDDATTLFGLNLPAGGLTYQILMNRPFEELRRNCHDVVSDEALVTTVALIQQNTFVESGPNTARLCGGAYFKNRIDRMHRAIARSS